MPEADPETVARDLADVRRAERLIRNAQSPSAHLFPPTHRDVEKVCTALLLSKESLAAREAEVERLKKALRSIADNPWSKDPTRLTREDAIVNFTASCAQARAALSAASRCEEGT